MYLSVGIPVYNGAKCIRACLLALEEELKDIQGEVIVCDDGSVDNTGQIVKERFPHVNFLQNAANQGTSAATNAILHRAQGKFFLRLDADSELLPGALIKLLDFLEDHPQAGMVIAQLIGPDGRWQRNFQTREMDPLFWLGQTLIWPQRIKNRVWPDRLLFEGKQPFLVKYAASAAALVRREALDKIGGLDESLPFFMEDADWSHRFNLAGWQVWLEPQAKVKHFGGHSEEGVYIFCRERCLTSLYRFYEKHYPGKINQLMLAIALCAGSIVSLGLALLFFLPAALHPSARTIAGRGVRSFSHLLNWHFQRIIGRIKS